MPIGRSRRMRQRRMLRELLHCASDFKQETTYVDASAVEGEAAHARDYPAAWIAKTIELVEVMDGRTVVEIGSTRQPVRWECIAYYDACRSPAPPARRIDRSSRPGCCLDGHSTYFWARSGLETHTVDTDQHCRDVLLGQYASLGEPVPDNLHIWAPRDGIDFLESCEVEIDLLYLDGWDVGHPGYAEKHVEAFLAAEAVLASSHLVSIDDADFGFDVGGKDHLLGPYLIDRGYVPLLSGRQRVFCSPPA